ncbi:polar amino acid transport system substrate-binding protein [Saccharopolyspora phatthalungensis]|uniref:Polar amino acid transport system substrate-binding protein n=1 Tax=Saccharopolyspora phatthalungensis TaxID=664693 RepID=A0A840QEM8_9PSEU|nr:polar amino acid transport system substrate-binding protein [Saccharopolyspora phatthalungensis]
MRSATAAAAALLLATVAGCSSAGNTTSPPAEVAAPAGLVDSGSLTYGTAATFPPFEFKGDGGKPTGFDIEMAQALAGYMGLKPEPMDVDFDGLIPALQGKRVDIINSAMYMTPQRQQQVDFIPYLVIGESMLVPKGNPKGITRIPDDLSGKTVAVTRGAIGETYMNEFNADLTKRGLPPMTIMALPSNQDALLAVRSGRADTFDTSTPGAAYTLAQTKGEFAIAGTFKVGTKIGIAVRKGDTNTANAIKAALDKFVASGKYQELLAKYDLPPEVNYFAGTAPQPSPTTGAGN